MVRAFFYYIFRPRRRRLAAAGRIPPGGGAGTRTIPRLLPRCRQPPQPSMATCRGRRTGRSWCPQGLSSSSVPSPPRPVSNPKGLGSGQTERRKNSFKQFFSPTNKDLLTWSLQASSILVDCSMSPSPFSPPPDSPLGARRTVVPWWLSPPPLPPFSPPPPLPPGSLKNESSSPEEAEADELSKMWRMTSGGATGSRKRSGGSPSPPPSPPPPSSSEDEEEVPLPDELDRSRLADLT